MKFLADPALGKLAKWMRILGYDTIYYKGNIDRNFLRKAAKEGRIVLTRKKDLKNRSFSGRMIIIQDERVGDQIRCVMCELSMKPDPARVFTICLKCNEMLKKISREKVEEMVPVHVFRTYDDFKICPQCKGIFWPGTHRDNMLRLRQSFLTCNHSISSSS